MLKKKNLNKEKLPLFDKWFQTKEEEETFYTLFFEAGIISVSIRSLQENYRPISLKNIDIKFFNKK